MSPIRKKQVDIELVLIMCVKWFPFKLLEYFLDDYFLDFWRIDHIKHALKAAISVATIWPLTIILESPVCRHLYSCLSPNEKILFISDLLDDTKSHRA
jgi:hypothetical protein